MTSLPIINFSEFLTGNAEQKLRVAKTMRDASETIGFFMLSHVGISSENVSSAFEASKMFFDLPSDEKSKISWENAESNRGYVAVKREALDPTQKSDLKEAFNVGTLKSDQIQSSSNKNKWPNELPMFRENVEPFIEQCTLLSTSILKALALALDINENHFSDAHSLEENTFRLLHYPALRQDEGLEEDQKRAGAHTDYGSITLLFQDDTGGLEVKNKQGEWIHVVPVSDCIVVNIGDLMQRWTNDVLSSNAHRVTQPEHAKHLDRYSIAYFCTPNSNEIIDVVDSCITETNPKKYPPITTKDHMLERLNRTY
jgi:isopenicillin N synthase-like dioxygenase